MVTAAGEDTRRVPRPAPDKLGAQHMAIDAHIVIGPITWRACAAARTNLNVRHPVPQVIMMMPSLMPFAPATLDYLTNTWLKNLSLPQPFIFVTIRIVPDDCTAFGFNYPYPYSVFLGFCYNCRQKTKVIRRLGFRQSDLLRVDMKMRTTTKLFLRKEPCIALGIFPHTFHTLGTTQSAHQVGTQAGLQDGSGKLVTAPGVNGLPHLRHYNSTSSSTTNRAHSILVNIKS